MSPFFAFVFWFCSWFLFLFLLLVLLLVLFLFSLALPGAEWMLFGMTPNASAPAAS
jgi:hypothetical protein